MNPDIIECIRYHKEETEISEDDPTNLRLQEELCHIDKEYFVIQILAVVVSIKKIGILDKDEYLAIPMKTSDHSRCRSRVLTIFVPINFFFQCSKLRHEEICTLNDTWEAGEPCQAIF